MKRIVHIALAALTCAVLSGCLNGDTGGRLVIGNHIALPKVSTPSGELELMVYESTEGMSFTTRKDCLVEIEYVNTFTNDIFGVWTKVGTMRAKGKIEPLQVEAPQDEQPQSEQPAAATGD